MKKSPLLLTGILFLSLLLSGLSGCGGENGKKVRPVSGEAESTGSEAKWTIRVATTFTGEDSYKNVWQQVLIDFSE